jgi:hypothetical protein
VREFECSYSFISQLLSIALSEILKEAIYFQLPQLVKDILRSGRKKGVCEYLTVRYLPGATYDGWPIRIEGSLLPAWIKVHGCPHTCFCELL